MFGFFFKKKPKRGVETTLPFKLLREALCTSGVAKSELSVRPSVRKIIDFCEAEIEGASLLTTLGSLRLRFSATLKLTPT